MTLAMYAIAARGTHDTSVRLLMGSSIILDSRITQQTSPDQDFTLFPQD